MKLLDRKTMRAETRRETSGLVLYKDVQEGCLVQSAWYQELATSDNSLQTKMHFLSYTARNILVGQLS